MTLSETPSKEQHENGTTYQTSQRSSGLTSNNRLVTPTSVNSFNCVIVKCLVVHSLGDIICVCLACLVPQNLKQSATTPVLHWKKKIQCGCTCVYNRIVSSSSSSVEHESSPTVLSSAGLGMPGTHR